MACDGLGEYDPGGSLNFPVQIFAVLMSSFIGRFVPAMPLYSNVLISSSSPPCARIVSHVTCIFSGRACYEPEAMLMATFNNA